MGGNAAHSCNDKEPGKPEEWPPRVDLGVAGHTDHTRIASQRAKVPDSLRIDNHMRIEGNLTWKAKYKSSPHGAACTEIWASHDNTCEVNSGIVDCSLIHVTWEARQHTHVITKDLGNPKSGLPGVDIGGGRPHRPHQESLPREEPRSSANGQTHESQRHM